MEQQEGLWSNRKGCGATGGAVEQQEELRSNKLLPRTVRHLLLCIGRAAGRQVASWDTTLCLGGAAGQQSTTSDSTLSTVVYR